MRDSGSFIQVHGHDLPVDDMVCGVAVRNIDARVLAGRLGQSLLETLLKRPRHLPVSSWTSPSSSVILESLDVNCFSRNSFSTRSLLASACRRLKASTLAVKASSFSPNLCLQLLKFSPLHLGCKSRLLETNVLDLIGGELG